MRVPMLMFSQCARIVRSAAAAPPRPHRPTTTVWTPLYPSRGVQRVSSPIGPLTILSSSQLLARHNEIPPPRLPHACHREILPTSSISSECHYRIPLVTMAAIITTSTVATSTNRCSTLSRSPLWWHTWSHLLPLSQ